MKDYIEKLMKEEELSVNITSLIDVIFILLIFFMVSTQFKKNSLSLELPQSENTEVQETKQNEKTVSVTKDKIELDGKIISIDELEAALKEVCKNNPELSVFLECDKNVDFQRVVAVLTKIQQAGITKIGIVHERSL
ncbi:biopolymer transporter ExbD [Treponema sp.]|uniref:ExbD/TolR family protein n=1 Tax=Treponema sp. TaxID=166 RepID=UPI00298E0F6A|nr:biopolymer transporter ExbD [Treponema sp.]MCR5612606.1 biopolymer transporter ExbD [Treponema sp.]